jgi:RimJ/RimL family protein N-acetyltransferase
MKERLFRLRSGDWVLVRPLHRDDSPALAAVVEKLSEQSRYRRFHSLTSHLSEQKLRSLTDIDHHTHDALVALVPRSPEILGVARFVRDAEDSGTAELAIMVGDDWQRRGLGTLLLGQLARRAANVGISDFTAEILAENTPTLALVHQLGTSDLTHHGQTVTARIDATEWLPAEDLQA